MPALRIAPAAVAAVAAVAASALSPLVPAAHAHGLVGRADLPVPVEVFMAAAAAVLVVSFGGLAASWSKPRLEEERGSLAVLPLPRVVDVALGAFGVACLVAVVVAGLWGAQTQRDNLAPTIVYVAFWVGIPFASLLLGDVFRLLSPWRAIGRATGWFAERVAPGRLPAPHPYPEGLGRWPAAAGLLAFAVIELVWSGGQEPVNLALLALAYLVIALAGMSVYGVEAWTRNADAFGVWFSLVARLAPFERRDGVLRLRVPGTGLTRARAGNGTIAVLAVAIGSTAFDSIRESGWFGELASGFQRGPATDAGLSLGAGLELAFLLGLLATVALVAAVYLVAVGAMPLPRGLGRRTVALRMSHTLVPIAVAYLVAHYFSLLVYNGQDVWRLASDPLGTGTDLFGTATASIDYGVVSATAIWYVQVGALVAGHVAALVLGHDRALALYREPGDAARSQLVMLLLMVSFTVLGLWLLSEVGG